MKVMGIYNAYNPRLSSDLSNGSPNQQSQHKSKEEKELEAETSPVPEGIALQSSAARYFRKSIDSLFTSYKPNIPSKKLQINQKLLKMNNPSGNLSSSNSYSFGDSLSDVIPQNPIFKMEESENLSGFEKIKRNYRYTKSKKTVSKLKYHFGLAIELLKRKEYVAAISYFESALKLAQAIRYDSSKFVIYELLARTHDKLSDLNQSLDCYLKAYEIADNRCMIGKKVQIANNIGSIYADYSAYDKSIEWYKKAYKFSRSLNDPEITKQILEDLVIAKKYQQLQDERIA